MTNFVVPKIAARLSSIGMLLLLGACGGGNSGPSAGTGATQGTQGSGGAPAAGNKGLFLSCDKPATAGQAHTCTQWTQAGSGYYAGTQKNCATGSLNPCPTDLQQYSCGFCSGADCATVYTYADRQADGTITPQATGTIASQTCAAQGGLFMTYTLPTGMPAGAHLTGVTQLAAAGNYACAIRSDKSLKCWGSQSISDGTMADLTGLGAVSAVGVGGGYACAVKDDGTVWCWGVNNDGQLGNGGPGAASAVPVQLSGIMRARSIALGDDHGCALISDGTVMCWGAALLGQIGIGTTPLSLIAATPTAVTGLIGVTALSAAGAETCALLDDGTIDCWGGKGSASSTAIPSPTRITGLPSAMGVGLSASAVCALLTDGTVQCWNALGTPSTVGPGDVPVPVPGTAAVIAGLSGVTSLAQYQDTTCALKGGAAECWTFSSLFGGNRVPAAAPGVSGATQLAVGLNFTCALVADGAVLCWGLNDHGQLGGGTTASSSATPVYVLP